MRLVAVALACMLALFAGAARAQNYPALTPSSITIRPNGGGASPGGISSAGAITGTGLTVNASAGGATVASISNAGIFAGSGLTLSNATSGTIALTAPTGALGTQTLTVPDVTGTLITSSQVAATYAPLASPTFTGAISGVTLSLSASSGSTLTAISTTGTAGSFTSGGFGLSGTSTSSSGAYSGVSGSSASPSGFGVIGSNSNGGYGGYFSSTADYALGAKGGIAVIPIAGGSASATISDTGVISGAQVCLNGTGDCLLHTGSALAYQPGGTAVASIGDIGQLLINQSGGTPFTADAGATVILYGPSSGNEKLEQFSFAGSTNFYGLRVNGSPASPSAVQNGNGLAVFSGGGYRTTTVVDQAAYMTIYASDNWTDTDDGAEIRWFTTPNGSTTPTSKMALSNGGNVAIGAGVTGTSASDLLQIIGGKIYTSGTTPTISSCGASPAISGTDVDMKITVGTGTVTTCSVTFGNTGYTQAPRGVQLTAGNATAAGSTGAYVSVISATGFTITGTALAGAIFYARVE